MSAVLAGHDGVLCHMDAVFIFGRDHDERDTHVRITLHTIQEAGVTLKPEKCEFSKGASPFWARSSVSRAFLLTPARLGQ